MGTDRDRALARIVGRCRKRTHCGSADCPVCERRRRRVKRLPVTSRPASAPSVMLLCASEIDNAALPVRRLEGE
jgi:hypothetical protein